MSEVSRRCGSVSGVRCVRNSRSAKCGSANCEFGIVFLSLQPYRRVFPIGRTHSSVGQSSGLIIRRSWDHAPLGPRVVEGLHFLQVFFRFGRCPRGRDFDDAGRNRSAGRSPFGVIRAGSQAFVAPRTDGPRACTIAVLVCPPVSTAAAKKVLPPAVRPFCIRVSRKSAGASAA